MASLICGDAPAPGTPRAPRAPGLTRQLTGMMDDSAAEEEAAAGLQFRASSLGGAAAAAAELVNDKGGIEGGLAAAGSLASAALLKSACGAAGANGWPFTVCVSPAACAWTLETSLRGKRVTIESPPSLSHVALGAHLSGRGGSAFVAPLPCQGRHDTHSPRASRTHDTH